MQASKQLELARGGELDLARSARFRVEAMNNKYLRQVQRLFKYVLRLKGT